MNLTPDSRLRIRLTLIVIILATLPCYCTGYLIMRFVQNRKLNMTPTAVVSWTPVVPVTHTNTFTPEIIITENRATATFTETATLTPVLSSTLTPTSIDTLPPIPTDTAPFISSPTPTNAPLPTETPTYTLVPTPTDTLTATSPAASDTPIVVTTPAP